MDYVRVRSFWDQRLPGLEAAEKKAIYAAMVSTLARLHRVDPAAVCLTDLGRPDGYVSRQVARWTRHYRESERHRIAPMDKPISWIRGHDPHTTEAALYPRESYWKRDGYGKRGCITLAIVLG